MDETRQYHVLVKEEDGGYWGEVIELPGCFASGRTFEEFKDSLSEAISLCAPPLQERGRAKRPEKRRQPAALASMVVEA